MAAQALAMSCSTRLHRLHFNGHVTKPMLSSLASEPPIALEARVSDHTFERFIQITKIVLLAGILAMMFWGITRGH
jgi:hypothetical protein